MKNLSVITSSFVAAFIGLMRRYRVVLILTFLLYPGLSAADPKYIAKIDRQYVIESVSMTPSITWLESDNGLIYHKQKVDGVGVAATSEGAYIRDWISLYAKGSPGGNIPYRLTRAFSGYLFGSRNSTGYRYNTVFGNNLRGYNHCPTTYIYSPIPIYQYCVTTSGGATSAIVPIDFTSYGTGTTNNVPQTTPYTSNYYQISFETRYAQVNRSKTHTPPYPSGTEPTTDVDVNLNFFIATDPILDRIRRPGNNPGPTQQYTCGGAGMGASGPVGDTLGSAGGATNGYSSLMSISQNFATGNVQTTINDPVPTRGYPLRNRIHLNSQAVELTRPMANATFTYDIHVTTQSLPPSGGGSAVDHWILVDGDGQRLNFGPTSSAPTPEAGVFSTLTQTLSGFELTNAGPPENIRSAGNFFYEFESNGNLISLIDPAGNEQQLTYTSGLLTNVLDVNSNKEIDYTYSSGRISQISQNGGADTYITYTSDKVTKIELKEGSTVNFTADFTYDGSGRLSTIKRDGDAASTYTITYVTQTSLEPSATVDLASISWPTGASHVAYNQDSAFDSRTSVANSSGGATHYDFDTNWDVKKITLPAVTGATGPVEYTYSYDSNRNMTSSSDGSVSLTYTYTTNGILHKITEPGGYYKQFNYSGANLTSIEDSIGTLLTLTYGNMSLPNHPTVIEDALSNEWTYTYNSYGQVTQITPPTGSPLGNTTFTYDESSSSSPTYGWLTQITDGEGNIQTFDSYDAMGNITAYSTYVDPLDVLTKKTTSLTYDAGHRIKVITNPDSTTVTNSYSGGKLSYTDDEAGKRTNYTWCADCGALKAISKALSWAVSWERDSDQKVKKFLDPQSNPTTYSYGTSKELVGISYPDGSTEEYSYDDYGRLDTYTNARLQDTTTTYDSVGRVDDVTFPTTSEPTISYTYRTDSLPDVITDGTGTTTYDYYSNRLLKSVTYNLSTSGLTNAQKIEYTYNEDNSLDTMIWKDGLTTVATWSYTYDQSGRLASVTSFGETTDYTYDGQDKILTQENHNGTDTVYTYNDDRGWRTNISHEVSSTPFLEFDITYDGGSETVGNITRVDETLSDYITYTYNDLHRLTAEARTGTGSYSNDFVYDVSGNLTTLNSSSFATYDSGNKIASIPSGSISHDADGNITSVTGAGLSATTLTWDTRSKLASQTNSSVTITYGYNHDGLRTWSQVGADPKTYYIFSGSTLIGEISGASELPTAAYTHGADGLVSERRIQDSETYWYHFGPQGETRRLTDDTGTVVNSYAYDAYGKTLSSSGTVVNPYGYGGKYGYYSHGSAGMMLAEQRWYSPHLKRWVSRDPIKYEGGVNLYGYVEQNPVGFVDPDGLEAISVGAAGGFAGVGSSLSSGAAAIGRFIAKSPVGLAVGAGVGAGLLVGDCIFEGPDGCAATLQGMCSSNSSVYPTPKTKKNDWSREDQRAREDCYKNSRTRAELERCLQLVQKNSKAPVIKKK